MWAVEETYGGYKVVRDGIYDLMCDGVSVTLDQQRDAVLIAFTLNLGSRGA